MVGTALTEPVNAEVKSARDDTVRFFIASAVHEPGIRRLLRESPMPGAIRISMEREPDFFAAAAIEGSDHQTIVGVCGKDVVCAGSISARLRFVNGTPKRIGYLGGLRVGARIRGNASTIRRGYEFFRRTIHARDGPAIYLTSIIADNVRARRFLERGLPGMPSYRFVGEYVTLAIASRRHRSEPSAMYGATPRIADIIELVNQDHQRYQFAPVISEADVNLPGFSSADLRAISTPDGRLIACAALWDQRAVKQTVIRGYSGTLQRMRPWINAMASILGKPKLPAVGEPVVHAFVAHLASRDDGQADLQLELLQDCCDRARALGFDFVILGFDARDPRLVRLRKLFRPREYLSRIYAVYWDDGAKLASSLDARLLAPEVAFL